MWGRRTALGAASTLLLGQLPIPAAAEVIEQIDPATLTTRPLAGLSGVESTLLTGTFDGSGLYVAYGVMRAGAIFPAHHHPDLRLTVVVSGVMYLGRGGRFDDTALTAFPTGTAALTPPGTPHFMAAREGDFAVLEIGSGPSKTVFEPDA